MLNKDIHIIARPIKEQTRTGIIRPVYLHELMNFFVTGSSSSSGPKSCGTGTSGTNGGTVTWSTPGNITANDTSYAVASALTNTTFSRYLYATNFGFAISGSTVLGVQFTWVVKSTAGGSGIKDKSVLLTITGPSNTTGTDQQNGVTWGTSDGNQVYGSSSNTWGASPTISNVNGSTFGCALQAQGLGAAPSTANVNYVSCTVWYQ